MSENHKDEYIYTSISFHAQPDLPKFYSHFQKIYPLRLMEALL